MYLYHTGDSTTALKPKNPIISAMGDSNSAFLVTLVHKKFNDDMVAHNFSSNMTRYAVGFLTARGA